jgi:hypothetical protein
MKLGMKPRTRSIPGQDVQRKFYGESFDMERLQILQKARQIAKETMDEKQKEYKNSMTRRQKNIIFQWAKKCGIWKQTCWTKTRN